MVQENVKTKKIYKRKQKLNNKRNIGKNGTSPNDYCCVFCCLVVRFCLFICFCPITHVVLLFTPSFGRPVIQFSLFLSCCFSNCCFGCSFLFAGVVFLSCFFVFLVSVFLAVFLLFFMFLCSVFGCFVFGRVSASFRQKRGHGQNCGFPWTFVENTLAFWGTLVSRGHFQNGRSVDRKNIILLITK